METQETIEPSSETEPMAMIDMDFPPDTNLVGMSQKKLAIVVRNLFRLWEEIDQRNQN